jgi:hypothetical protein
MTKNKTKKVKGFEKWANNELRKLQKMVLLEHFNLLPIKATDKPSDNSCCVHHYPYQTIEIEYNQDVFNWWMDGNNHRAREVLTHEICHALTDEFYNKGFDRFTGKDDLEDAREKLTDHIANILLKLTNKK